MKTFFVVTLAAFTSGFLLGDAHGFINALEVFEAAQWAN